MRLLRHTAPRFPRRRSAPLLACHPGTPLDYCQISPTRSARPSSGSFCRPAPGAGVSLGGPQAPWVVTGRFSVHSSPRSASQKRVGFLWRSVPPHSQWLGGDLLLSFLVVFLVRSFTGTYVGGFLYIPCSIFLPPFLQFWNHVQFPWFYLSAPSSLNSH